MAHVFKGHPEHHVTLDHCDIAEAVREWIVHHHPKLRADGNVPVRFWGCKGNLMVVEYFNLAARLDVRDDSST